jgi:phenylpropionate dioxygenase-like ring-hydroxylating dioxygenase large terminal subunit
MYPFKTTQSFPRNQWYIAAFSHEVTRTPMERTLLEEPVVLYRTEAGVPVAVAGRCPHRRFPMVRGAVTGDGIQCAYHGWTFAGTSGACTHIPSQENFVPNGFKIRTYALVEKWQWLWIWMGDPAAADAATIPDHTYLQLENSDWEASVGGVEPLAGRYQLMSENVLDLTHITFIHAATIGTAGIAAAPIEVEDRGRYLHSQRTVAEPNPTPFHTRTLGLDGPVERVLSTDFFPPAFCSSGSAFYRAGESARADGHCYGAFRVFHIATPETAHTSHYFWAFTRSFGQNDTALTEQLRAGWRLGVLEDVDAIDANERMIDRGPLQNDLSAQSDAGPLRGRKMVESMILAERAADLRPPAPQPGPAMV